jgi:hypothetical protein
MIDDRNISRLNTNLDISGLENYKDS